MSSPTRTIRRNGVAINSRITAALGALLLVLLAAEGATIPFLDQLRPEHVAIGLILLAPVAAKLASTGYRFARYYLGSAPYVRKGPPQLAMRILAPGVVFTTVALLGTGVALELVPDPSDQLVFAHKLSFVAWFPLMTIHVLGHVLELPRLLGRRPAPAARAVAAGGSR